MELTAINNIRAQYLSLLSGDARYNDTLIKLTERPVNQPILSVTDLNAEDDLNYAAEQRQLSEMLLDMHAVNNGAVELKNTIQEIVTALDNSLDTILASAQKQKAQAEDLNVICGKDSKYSAILPVFTSDFGNTSAEIINDKTLGAAVTNADTVSLAAKDIILNPRNPFTNNKLDGHEKQEGHFEIIFAEDWGDLDEDSVRFEPADWFSVENNPYNMDNWEYLGFY